ncbi:MAG: sulfite exporter TauE/SafE family protein, partial [Magnetovibrio sp.]|nr:sulfite exporter TauE/SafE family protein [Magnetovibrio sp.]
SLNAIRKSRKAGGVVPTKRRQRNWVHALPFKMRFRRSKLYISAILPIGIGVLVGILSAIMGVGGGFIMVPAMIYMLGMPTAVVVGTSLFQIIFVTANVTVLQSVNNFAVDVVLAMLLLFGAVIGAQFGAKAGAKLKGEQLRVLLAIMVLAMCIKIGLDLTLTPDEFYAIGTTGGH